MRTTGFFKTMEGKNYLLCNGQEVPYTYPKLRALMTHTPNLTDRVPWGAGTFTPGTYLDAGLPNITGAFGYSAEESGFFAEGAFYLLGHGPGAPLDGGSYSVGFNASLVNPIYGRSNTVRPPSLVVQFYIRAK